MADLNLGASPASILLDRGGSYDVTDFHKMRNADQSAADQHAWMGLQSQESQQKIDEQKYWANARTIQDKAWVEAAKIGTDQSAKPGSPPDSATASNDRVTSLPGDNSAQASPATPGATPLSDDTAGGPTGVPGPQSDGAGNRPSLAAPDGPNPTGAGTGVAEPTGLPGEVAPAGTPSPTSPVDRGSGSSRAAAPGQFPMSGTQRRDAQTQYVVDAMNKAGYHTAGMAANAALMKGYKDAAELHDKELETVQRKVELTGDIMQSVTKVDQTADPATQTADMQMWKTTAAAAVGKLAQNGLITPQQGQAMLQKVSEGWNPQVAQQIEAQAQSAKNHAANLNAAREQNQVAQIMIERGVKIDQAKAIVAKDDLANAAQTVRANGDADSLTKWYGSQKPGVQATVAPIVNNPDLTWDQKVDRIAALGVSEKDRPEYDIKTGEASQLKKLTPADWDAQIDAAVPPGPNALLNSRTKALVKSALAHGDFKAAQTAIKDGADQIGSVEKGVAIAKATAPIKISIASAEANAKANAGGTTADDYARAGEEYTITGQMPALGRDSVTRNRIMHAAMDYQRSQGLSPRDVVMARGAYAGDKSSLTNLVKQRDQINAFEETAGKNLDTFLELAGKVVDSGSPWINKPLRTVASQGLGSEDLAALNAARAVATNEVAKVTSGGGINGVLSDAARQEVKEYNPQNATLKQTLAVVKVLRRDMQARHDALDNAVSRIRERSGSELSGGGNAASGNTQHKIGDVVKIQGKNVKISAIHADGTFDGDEVK